MIYGIIPEIKYSILFVLSRFFRPVDRVSRAAGRLGTAQEVAITVNHDAEGHDVIQWQERDALHRDACGVRATNRDQSNVADQAS